MDVEPESIEDFLDTLSEFITPFSHNIKQYIKELEELLVEEFLDDKQIIEYVNRDPNEEIISDSEPELEIIGVKEAAQGLKNFITFFTQQLDDSNFDHKDLKVFRKYSKLMNLKLIENRKQTSINSFFTIID